jgi:uncharacterized protein YggT (Ycf19 family)
MPDDAKPAETSRLPERVRRYWPGLTAFIATVSAVGGAVLYLVGTTVSQTYFGQWGLSAAMFPSSPDEMIVLGYHALMNELAKAYLRVIGKYVLWLVGYALLIWLAAVLVAKWENRGGKTQLANAMQRYEGPFRAFAMLLGSLGLVVATPLAAFVMIILLFSWPLTAGDAYGKEWVLRQHAEFKPGCDNPAVPAKCIALLRGDNLVARGFLIGSGERVVALFDPSSGRTVLMEREGLVLRGAPRSAPAAASGPSNSR